MPAVPPVQPPKPFLGRLVNRELFQLILCSYVNYTLYAGLVSRLPEGYLNRLSGDTGRDSFQRLGRVPDVIDGRSGGG